MLERNALVTCDKINQHIAEIRVMNDAVSTESAFGTLSDGIKKHFKNIAEKFDDLADSLSDRISAWVTTTNPNRIPTKSDIKYATKNKTYRDVIKRQVPVLVGMRSDLLKTTMLLKRDLKLLDGVAQEAVDELNFVMAELISSEDARKSFNAKTIKAFSGELMEIIDNDLQDIMGKNDNYKDRMRVEELIPNFASLSTVAENLSIISQFVDKRKLVKLEEGLDDLEDKIENLIELMESKDNEFTMSKPAFDTLVTTVERIANGITKTTVLTAVTVGTFGTFENLIKVIGED